MRCISIHAPRVGSDALLWGHQNSHDNFNPRSPCGERLTVGITVSGTTAISIHAPRVGSDVTVCHSHTPKMELFQSTLPVWGATDCPDTPEGVYDISIHAPRVGSDGNRESNSADKLDFNPRSPCGERHGCIIYQKDQNGFQSTLPVWGATRAFLQWCDDLAISIHAPRVGSDLTDEFSSPDGRKISIHAPRVGSDRKTLPPLRPWPGDFNPRSPCGERQQYSTCTVHAE